LRRFPNGRVHFERPQARHVAIARRTDAFVSRYAASCTIVFYIDDLYVQAGVGNLFTGSGKDCQDYVKTYCEQAHNRPSVVEEEIDGTTVTRLQFSTEVDPGCTSPITTNVSAQTPFTIFSFTK
jgi:hypothetical protein